MRFVTTGINIDAEETGTHPFLRRRLANAGVLHGVDGAMLYLALLAGDLVLSVWRGIPVQIGSSLLMLPVWWIVSWPIRLVPGWGMSAVDELRRIQLLLLALFATAIGMLFLQRGSTVSRISFVTAYLAATALIPLGRVAAKQALLALNLWGVPAVIYGSRETVPVVADALRRARLLGYLPMAVMSDEFRQGEVVAGLPVLGRLDNTSRRFPVAVAALPDLPRKQLINLMEGPLQTYGTVLLVPDLRDAPSLWVKPCDLQGVLALEIRRNLLDPFALSAKTLVERSLVVLTLPLWGPLCLLLMLLVWMQDHHPAIYAQERIGRNNVPFKTYKLRTMVPDAEKVLKQRLAADPALREEWQVHYKLKKDPRITPVGKFLRKTSLDELPQLWSVLTGRMALVGPRPLPAYHHGELSLRTQRLRVLVRPGMTGLWQVSGRSDSGSAGMDMWDAYYVTNWSIWLDLIIVARTVRVVLFGHGAY